mmetsp:Transcript_22992/g.42313  ORF Transcript_22992/g.42313 Transcript_22992/m.42313 type:complete len:755 (-) Transcript_22992:77-2341(-)
MEAAKHCCRECGAAFDSRNQLFKHLQEQGCVPEARAGAKQADHETLALVVGYLGSKYHGSNRGDLRNEGIYPTVEGAVWSAANRAWGDVVVRIASYARTEKGMHAEENVIILTLRSCAALSNVAALHDELQGSEVWLLAAPCKPVAGLGLGSINAERRAFSCYIPYSALLRLSDLPKQEDSGLWIANLQTGSTCEDVVQLLWEALGEVVQAADVSLIHTGCIAHVKMAASLVPRACAVLDGRECPPSELTLLVRPLAEAEAKLRVHARTREALQRLRGESLGQRSFHNFIPGTSMNSPQAVRSLQHCAISFRRDVLCGVRACGSQWQAKDFAVVSIAAKSFAPRQLRHVLGVLVAVVRGLEDVEYIDRCFEEIDYSTPEAPAEAIVLEHLTIIKGGEKKWRHAVGLSPTAAPAGHEAVVSRVIAECEPLWADFVQTLEAGATKAPLRKMLFDAMEQGDVDALGEALRKGADLNAGDEYGATALLYSIRAGAVGMVQTLLGRQADVNLPAHGSGSPLHIAAVMRAEEVQAVLQSAGAVREAPAWQPSEEVETAVQLNIADVKAQVLIPKGHCHAGAGTTVLDGLFSETFLLALQAVWQQLPLAPREKASPTDRAYFMDLDGWVTRCMNFAIASATGGAGEVLRHMRFLHYSRPGGSLPPHVDLPRVEPSGRRSTHTFLLYLTDCWEGGETMLLEGLAGDEALAHAGGVAAGERSSLAAVIPRRGRLLLMPHACPHSAAKTVCVPKLLLRGEVYLP